MKFEWYTWAGAGVTLAVTGVLLYQYWNDIYHSGIWVHIMKYIMSTAERLGS